jgi:hypothetical protein
MTDENTQPTPQEVPVAAEPQFVFNCDPYTVTVGQLALTLNLLGVVINKSTYSGLPATLKALFRSVG